MATASPARSYALLLGFGLAITGVLGFFYSAGFGSGSVVPAEDIFGLFAVNGWSNALHVLSGLLGLAAAGSPATARAFALTFGAVYVAIAVWGFILGGSGTIAELIPINTADNVAHAVIGLLGLGAGYGSRERT